jgi:3',5'-cyclic AMP phosphodiesterase CpdA
MTDPAVLVQLSDCHIVRRGRWLDGRIDTPGFLAQAVHALRALPATPDAVLVSGDLVDAGDALEYAHLRELLAPLPCPVWLMPGNHDAVPALKTAFPDHAYLHDTHGDTAMAPFAQHAHTLGHWRVIALDTVVPGAPHGALCATRLRWLDQTLAQAPNAPTLIAMHHPPFQTGIAHMDAMGLREGGEALAAVIGRHPQVRRIVCGHLHRSIVGTFAGVSALTVPSTAHQIVLDWRGEAPVAWRAEPPGFAVHLLHDDGRIVSHTAVSGDWGPAQPF